MVEQDSLEKQLAERRGRQAERVVDMDSGSVDEGAAKALMTTMRNFDEHKSRMRLLGPKRRRVDTKQDLG